MCVCSHYNQRTKELTDAFRNDFINNLVSSVIQMVHCYILYKREGHGTDEIELIVCLK